jgi:hypothetical protein
VIKYIAVEELLKTENIDTSNALQLWAGHLAATSLALAFLNGLIYLKPQLLVLPLRIGRLYDTCYSERFLGSS